MDLFKIEDVVRVAETVRSDHQTIDSLILNAGIMMPKFNLTKIGIESQMQINFVSNKIFVDILLPLVMCSPNGKFIWVRSMFWYGINCGDSDKDIFGTSYGLKTWTIIILKIRESYLSFINRSSMVLSKLHLGKNESVKVKLWVRYNCLWSGSFI